jgi:hypothetical protein
LVRERHGLAYTYTPRYDRQEFAVVALSRLIDDVLAGDASRLTQTLATRYSAV